MKKKILSLGLATIVLISTVACTNQTQKVDKEDNDMKKIENQNTNQPVKEEQEIDSKYISYIGNISEISKEDASIYITVDSKNKENMHEKIKFIVSEETFVLSDKTLDFIEIEMLKEGMTIEAFYSKDAPMTRSIPPMTNATSIVLRESSEENKLGIKIDSFNKDLISSDNTLELSITDKTVIVDREGKKLIKEDILDQEVIVFFGPIMTLSMPGQSEAVKIILLEARK